MDIFPLIICTLSCHWAQPLWQPSMTDWRECDVFVRLPPKRPRKSAIVSQSPYVSQVPMTTNGGAHKFNKNENNYWLHAHFEPQQVDVLVSSIDTSPGQSECICPDSSLKI